MLASLIGLAIPFVFVGIVVLTAQWWEPRQEARLAREKAAREAAWLAKVDEWNRP